MQRRTKLGVGSLVAAGAVALAAVPMLGASVDASRLTHPAPPDAALRAHAARAPEIAGYKYWLVGAKAYQDLINAELARRAAAAAAAAARPRGGGGGGARCQDGALEYGTGTYSIPTEVVMRESGGWYGSCNESSGACGAYQVLPSTWDGYAGYGSACDAPPAVQDQWAAEAYAQSGCDPWGGC